MATGRKTHETYLQRRIRERRAELGGLSQQELADLADIGIGVVRRLEQGRGDAIEPKNERRLAEALRWADDWLDKLRSSQEPEERTDNSGAEALPAQLRSIMALSWELEESMRERALNEALRAFVKAASAVE